MKTAILGAGSWGVALAKLLTENKHEVTVWSIDPEEVSMLKTTGEQKTKLPGVILPASVEYTTDLAFALQEKELVVFAVPSPFIRSTAKSASPYITKDMVLVCVAKGIEESSLKLLNQVIEDEIPQAETAVLSGPSHAEEVGKLMPTTVVVGAKKKKTAEMIQDVFMTDFFRVYISPDMIGIELGAALKNVIALAAGMADGLGCGDNTKAALITRGIHEIRELAVRMGGHAETLSGLSGIGDLIVTCASRHSRNRKAGYLMGQGLTMQQAMDEVHMVVEGVYSAKAALMLAQKYGIEMPIVEMVNRILFQDFPAKDGLHELLTRDRKREVETLEWQAE